jgi:hypothetical protein
MSARQISILVSAPTSQLSTDRRQSPPNRFHANLEVIGAQNPQVRSSSLDSFPRLSFKIGWEVHRPNTPLPGGFRMSDSVRSSARLIFHPRHGLPPGAFPRPFGRRRRTRHSRRPELPANHGTHRMDERSGGSAWSVQDRRGDVDLERPKLPMAGFPSWSFGRRPVLRSRRSWRGRTVSTPPPGGAASRVGERGTGSRRSRTGGDRNLLLDGGRRTPECDRVRGIAPHPREIAALERASNRETYTGRESLS